MISEMKICVVMSFDPHKLEASNWFQIPTSNIEEFINRISFEYDEDILPFPSSDNYVIQDWDDDTGEWVIRNTMYFGYMSYGKGNLFPIVKGSVKQDSPEKIEEKKTVVVKPIRRANISPVHKSVGHSCEVCE